MTIEPDGDLLIPVDHESERTAATGPVAVRGRRRSRLRGGRVLRRLFRNRAAVIAICFIVVVVAVALLSNVWTPKDPARQSLRDRLDGPSGDHWLGTDSLGRDNLSRLMEGARITLLASVQAIGLAVIAGLPTGLVAGFAGKRVDAVLSRVADVLLSLPPLILSLAIVGILGTGLTNAMIAVGIVLAPRFFRVARAAGISVRNETYIEAARAIGCSPKRILFGHVLPNAAGPILVQLTFSLGLVITAEASLSFLGLGTTPPTASWGTMVRDAFTNINRSKFQLLAPSLAITLSILAFSVLGDALRDALGRQRRTGE